MLIFYHKKVDLYIVLKQKKFDGIEKFFLRKNVFLDKLGQARAMIALILSDK